MLDEIAEKFPLYICGGACRDEILGIEPHDIDYVVQATKLEFESSFPLKCIGDSFPVYLDPITGSEISLTRSEKSTGNGYHDFEYTSGVSIEEDLFRRDFAHNSIAKPYNSRGFIDPTGGIFAIKRKLIITVNNKAFIDDPLRIIRGLRQAVQFGFDIEPNTLELMRQSVHLLSTITMERICLELEKVYKRCEKPSQFFRLLDSIDGLRIHFNELELAKDVVAGRVEHHPEGSVYNHVLESFDRAKESGYSFSVAIAALVHDISKIDTPKEVLPKHIGHENRLERAKAFVERHRFDSYTNNLILVTAKNHMRTHLLDRMKPTKLIRFIRSVRRNYLDDFLSACDCDSRLTIEQKSILYRLIKTLDTTKINLPDEVKKRGTESIKQYVENQYVNRYKELLNERT